MSDLIARYVHQVGRYLPPKQRAEIEAELQSQIQDQLDDRYAGTPSAADTAKVLAEFGHPYKIAASYLGDRYLIGPQVYPFMMMVLRPGWLIVPSIILFLSIFGAVTTTQPVGWASWLFETVASVFLGVLLFSALVVMCFAFIEQTYPKLRAQTAFDPLTLPKVDDPRAVDRVEAAFGLAIDGVVMLIAVWSLRETAAGTPQGWLHIPQGWLVLFILDGIAMGVMQIIGLRRNQWNTTLWLAQTLFELIGSICLYFVLYQPALNLIVASHPDIQGLPLMMRIPEILVTLTAIGTLFGRGKRAMRLVNYSNTGARRPM